MAASVKRDELIAEARANPLLFTREVKAAAPEEQEQELFRRGGLYAKGNFRNPAKAVSIESLPISAPVAATRAVAGAALAAVAAAPAGTPLEDIAVIKKERDDLSHRLSAQAEMIALTRRENRDLAAENTRLKEEMRKMGEDKQASDEAVLKVAKFCADQKNALSALAGAMANKGRGEEANEIIARFNLPPAFAGPPVAHIPASSLTASGAGESGGSITPPPAS